MKTRKSLTKRFKITNNGKVIYRAAGQDHFRSKKSGQFKRSKRKKKTLPKGLAKQVKRSLKYHGQS